ncbi:MAG: hypothetical protein GY811_06865 [Myxococcales bacterium]|nr:hypothetical protein [Myxococcales bacterium]
MRILRILLPLLTLGGAGCVGTSTTLQTAPTVKKGDIRLTGGMSVPVSTRYVEEIADVLGVTADRLSDADTTALTKDEQREAVEGAAAILLLQPGFLYILEGRYGLADRFELGIKWAGAAVRLGGKYWLHHEEGGLDASVAFGYTHHSGVGSSVAKKAFEVFDFLELVDYSRRDADLAILLSGDSRARFGFYGALRYVVGFVNLETNFERLMTEEATSEATVKEQIHNLGGTGGMRLRAGPVQIMAELTVMRMMFAPTILDETVDLGGYLIEPSIGASFAF